MTFNIEVGASPTGVVLCYSTSPNGSSAPAVTGGYVWVTPSGVLCTQDSSPVLVGVDCTLRDDTPGSPGRTLDMTIRVQDQPIHLVAGVEVAPPRVVACLYDTTIDLPTGTVGPVDIGVCP